MGICYRDKCRGILVGGMVGDALGAPWEGESSSSIKREVPSGPFDFFDHREMTDIKLAAELTGIPLGPCTIGEFTDDTECMMALTDSLIQAEGISTIVTALSTCLWWCSTPHMGGYSSWTWKKLELIHEGSDISELEKIHGNEGPSWANGAAMRIAPLGAAYRKLIDENPEFLRERVKTAVRFTHTHDEAFDAALMITCCVSWCLKIENVKNHSKMELIELLLAFSNTEEMKKRLLAIQDKLKQTKDLTIEEIKDHSTVFNDLDKEFLQSICTTDKWFQIRAIDAVSYVLFIFLKYTGFGCFHDDSVGEYCLVRIICLGGDCDTLACMLGSLLGSLFGYSWIPSRWKDKLQNHPLKGFSNALELGDKLSGLDLTEPADENKEEIKKLINNLKEEIKKKEQPVRHSLH